MLDITKLQNRKVDELLYSDTITLDESIYKDTDIRSISEIIVNAKIHRVTDSSYKMNLDVSGTMVLPCSITLKDVNYPFHIVTEVKLSENDDFDEDYVRILQNNIDIISIIWQNIVLEIPTKVVSDNIDDITTSGEGWKLIRED